MSKDTINPKRYILTQEQIDAYKNWILDRNHIFKVYADDYEAICEWEKNHPCPLPNPVEANTEAIRDKMDADMEDSGMAQGEIESCLNHWFNKYLIFNKP